MQPPITIFIGGCALRTWGVRLKLLTVGNRGIWLGYYITVERNVNAYVEDLDPGNGKPILFIHGWPVNYKMYEYQFNQLPKMGYRCIGVDLRGFGKSNHPWTGYSYDRLADDIRIVIETLLLNDITLAGHSMGGAIAIRYMARHAGQKVSKLALFGAAAPSFTRRTDYPHHGRYLAGLSSEL